MAIMTIYSVNECTRDVCICIEYPFRVIKNGKVTCCGHMSNDKLTIYVSGRGANS